MTVDDAKERLRDATNDLVRAAEQHACKHTRVTVNGTERIGWATCDNCRGVISLVYVVNEERMYLRRLQNIVERLDKGFL